MSLIFMRLGYSSTCNDRKTQKWNIRLEVLCENWEAQKYEERFDDVFMNIEKKTHLRQVHEPSSPLTDR